MFLFDNSEEEFHALLQTYKEEYGSDRLLVLFPKQILKKLDVSKFKPIEIKSWEAPMIGIRVTGGRTAYYNIHVVNFTKSL
jgi:hypothetical protein